MTNVIKCVVHIGFHKTGSTSIQTFLARNKTYLRKNEVYFYNGAYIDCNHIELHVACMRENRTSTFKIANSIIVDRDYRENVKYNVKNFITSLSNGVALFSAEGLSLLIHDDETQFLAEMLPKDVTIVAYLRNKADYLRSHTAQFKRAGLTNVLDKESHAYVGPDTWLIDYDLRLASFRRTFGASNVRVIDYDHALRCDGNVIPSFLRAIGVEDSFTKADWGGVWENRTP